MRRLWKVAREFNSVISEFFDGRQRSGHVVLDEVSDGVELDSDRDLLVSGRQERRRRQEGSRTRCGRMQKVTSRRMRHNVSFRVEDRGCGERTPDLPKLTVFIQPAQDGPFYIKHQRKFNCFGDAEGLGVRRLAAAFDRTACVRMSDRGAGLQFVEPADSYVAPPGGA